MEHKYLIYALVDPNTNEIRYIGRSSNKLKRPKSHWQDPKVRNRRDYCHNWIRSIAPIRPEILVLESWHVATNDEINESEVFWIAYYKSIGSKLTNLTVGGEGSSGVKRSAETRAKLSRARTGKKYGPQSAEHKAKRIAAIKGLKPSKNTTDGLKRWQLENRHKTCKKVLREDGKVFDSVTEAAASIGGHVGNMSALLHGAGKTLGGYSFKFLDGEIDVAT